MGQVHDLMERHDEMRREAVQYSCRYRARKAVGERQREEAADDSRKTSRPIGEAGPEASTFLARAQHKRDEKKGRYPTPLEIAQRRLER